MSDSNGMLWRYRGTTPSPDEFVRSLWDGVLAQFLVVRDSTDELAGLVTAYNPDHRNGFVYFAMLLDPIHQNRGWPLEGGLMFIDHLFINWPFRKVYMETSEASARAFPSLLNGTATEEGRLREHEYWRGEYQDHLILAIYRKDWVAVKSRFGPSTGDEARGNRAPHH